MNATPLPSIADRAPYQALVRPRRGRFIEALDQRALPHAVVKVKIADADAAAIAIRKMMVRGAPLIGAVGAYGLALALDRDSGDAALARAHAALDATRPTAVNLRWALDRVRTRVAPLAVSARADAAWAEADAICDEDVAINHAIGTHGLELLRDLARKRAGPIDVMTHCNAGALATCGWGTATAPLFLAQKEGMALHVWVSETRPRLQGANLTAWEMSQRGIPHTLFTDGASGLLMRRGDVDIVIVGADRVARERRRLQQDRHLRQGARRARQPRSVLRRAAVADDRLESGHPATRYRSRSRSTRRSADRVSGRDDYGQTARVALAPARHARA